MFSSVPALFQFVLDGLSNIFNVYVSSSILVGFFSLWVLDRLFHIFDILKR